MSRDWVPDFPDLDGIGEVWNAPRNYNGRAPIVGLLGAHRCGESNWFATGAPYDPARPPTLYNADGIPFCCDPPPEIQGGALAGGDAAESVIYFEAGSGGALAGGDAAESVIYFEAGSGGALAGGDAAVKLYCNQYSFVCDSITRTMPLRGPTFLDREWRTTGGSGTFSLQSPIETGIPGYWILVRLPSVTSLYETTSPWDGRGSAVFTHASGLMSCSAAATLTVTCDD